MSHDEHFSVVRTSQGSAADGLFPECELSFSQRWKRKGEFIGSLRTASHKYVSKQNCKLCNQGKKEVARYRSLNITKVLGGVMVLHMYNILKLTIPVVYVTVMK
jgi:hypothetical protein